MNQLTAENITLIKDMCAKHGITFYDIQLEATDHIASMIEARWVEFPDEDFEHSIEAIYSHIDWRPFKYKHDADFSNASWAELSKKNKKVQIVCALLFCTIITISFINFGNIIGDLNLEQTFYWVSICFFILYIIGVLFIAGSYIQSKAMISFAHKKTYRSGIIYGVLMAFAGISRYLIGIEQSSKGVIIGAVASSAFFIMFIFQFIQPISKARKQYPELF